MKKYYLLCMTVVIVMLIGSEAVSKEEKLYESGLQFIDRKSYPQAIGILSDLGDYKQSKALVSKLRYIVNGDYIGAGNSLIAAIKSDGSVIQKGGYADSKSIAEWKNITALSTHGEFIEGLDENGKIATTCPYAVEELQQSTLNSSWAEIAVIEETPKLEHVKAFQSNYPTDVIALLENGSVKVLSSFLNEKDISAVNAWEDIVTVVKSGGFIAGLKVDGSVIAVGEEYKQYDVSKWKDIVAISSISNIINVIGLRKDGTVVAVGENTFGEGDVAGWTDIIAIASGFLHTVGLKRDGTVIATGDNSYGQNNISDWTDIVAIDASTYFTMGLKRDGTLLIAGSSYGGAPAPDVSNISGLLVPTIRGN